ncbi:MAG: hypothetical protein J6C45_08435 [Alistipes sp.]|nr:hypothetical protein [Alistipes sp.]
MYELAYKFLPSTQLEHLHRIVRIGFLQPSSYSLELGGSRGPSSQSELQR